MKFYTVLLWIMFPTIALASWAGYLFGKRRGKHITLTGRNSVGVPAPAVTLTEKDMYETSVEKRKPFLQKYDMVTVMFADIEGFSEITEYLNPETLVNALNDLFCYIDSIIDHYHIEKIKTIGDAYMCAGGIPHRNHTNPVDIILLALDVQHHLNKLGEENPNVWSVRIGIHTGQVIAGMIGHKKMSFDIWGCTVNMAARLETLCKAGKINISDTTYEKVKQYFDCEYHGILPNTKNITYFVNGLKSEFVQNSSNGRPVPNHTFFVQMQLLRLVDLEEYVESMMTDINSNMYFHNFKHIFDVYEHVELLAHSENVTDEDLLLLKTAALLHDIGYAISYNNYIHTLNEDIARESLQLFQYKPQQIDRVCKFMKATHYESVPNGILEEIMHDANHIYFGWVDYPERIINLYNELKEHSIPIKEKEWVLYQINRLSSHKFHTRAAMELIEVTVEQQIAKLSMVWP